MHRFLFSTHFVFSVLMKTVMKIGFKCCNEGPQLILFIVIIVLIRPEIKQAVLSISN